MVLLACKTRRYFAAAYLSKSLTWSFADLLLAYFLHIGLGFSAADTAVLLFVFLLTGAVSNVAFGVLVDTLGTERHVVLKMHVCGALLTVAGAWVQFGLALEHSRWFVAAGLLFRVAFALYDVPQTAMISLLPSGEEDAAFYVRLRSSLAAIARLTVTVANLLLAGWPAPIIRTSASLVLALCSVAIIATAGLLMYSARQPGNSPVLDPKRIKLALPVGTTRLLASFALAVATMPVVSRLLIFTPGTASVPHFGAWLLLSFTMGSVVGPLIAMQAESLHGWRRTWLGSIGLGVVTGDLLACVTQGPVAIAIGLAFVHGIGLGLMGTLQWQTASSLVREHAARTGQRTDGSLFGLVIFTIQCAVAAGSLLFAPLLNDFVAGGTYSAMMECLLISGSGVVIAALLLNQRTTDAA